MGKTEMVWTLTYLNLLWNDFNPLKCRDAIWRHRYGSTLVKAMEWYLPTASIKQCRTIFNGVPRYWPESCLTASHYHDVIMGPIASQITSLTIVYSIVYSDADQRIHQSSASLAFVRGIHRGPVNSLHKWPVTQKTFPFDDVIMWS